MFTTLLRPAVVALLANFLLAFLLWLYSLRARDVSIVDAFWPALVVMPVFVLWALHGAAPRMTWLALLALAWGLRLGLYIAWRNHGHGEDRRYQAIRARNAPHFEYKSLYLVFGLQAVLAWMVGWSLLVAVNSPRPTGVLDGLAAILICAGLAIETLADAQLTWFRADPTHQGAVLDRGLWRYSRHPNYFGEFCVWWGFYVAALAAGGSWCVFSPLLMSVLLMRVSGVRLLERDIGERRPAYREYIARTNAFFPGPTRPDRNIAS